MSDGIFVFDSPVGPLRARARGGFLVELSFQTSAFGEVETAHVPKAEQTVLHVVRTQVAEYFSRERTVFELPLQLSGSPFHRQVWEALCDIPYGHTVSYGQLAAKIGYPDAARAVGAANGANPIAIIVPCHRVIGASGSLVGYGGGLRRKQLLLDLESATTRLAFS